MKHLPNPALLAVFTILSPAIWAQFGPASVSVALQMRTGQAYKTGSPYCATKVYFTTNGAPDKTKAGHTERMCRDSLGRGRDEISPTLVEIYDPVEGVGYTLDTARRKAGRTVMVRASLDSNASVSHSAPAPRPHQESLGTQVIEGLVVQGTQITTPGVGGWDRVEERWFSPELGEVIVKRSGQSEWRLTNIDRSEPDPSLFRVPSNYTVEDTPDYGDVSAPAN